MEIRCKIDSFIMKVFNVLSWPVLRGRFMSDYYTLFLGVLYVPTDADPNDIPEQVREHEQIHYDRRQAYGPIRFDLMYALCPAFRLTEEVEAYMVQLKWAKRVFRLELHQMAQFIDPIADTLVGDYLVFRSRSYVRERLVARLAEVV